ncbi:hypothetical protein [Halorubrum sp. SD626R]|uniref:hypothetical protein n=1 Tax=Halorubrum sp. SD626R TaxID=1419722 RepID=UPI000A7EE1FF|nr:hypothetical protein [Halorubrum sp. SD626R]
MVDYDESALRQMAQAARHDSVTVENLKLKKKSGIIFTKKWLSAPVVSYLTASEQPHVILKSRDPVTINGENVGDRGYGTVLVITDERFLFIIGEENTDRVISIPFQSDVGFEFEPTTSAQNQSLLDVYFSVSFWIRHENGEIEIKPSNDLDYEDIWTIGDTVLDFSKGDVDWIQEEWWEDRAGEHDALYEMADGAQSDTVTARRLERIFSYLQEGETPAFILTEGDVGIGIAEGTGDESTIRWQQDDYFDWVAITSERILIAFDEEIESLMYTELDSVKISIQEHHDEYDDEYYEVPYLCILLNDFIYFIEGSDFTETDLRRAVRYIRNRTP